MKKITALFSVFLLCGFMVGCAPKADDGVDTGTDTPAVPSVEGEEGHEHAEGEEGHEHGEEAEGEEATAPAEGEEAAPAEEEAAPEAGSTES